MRVEEGSFGVPTLTHWLLPMLNHLVIRSPAKEMDVAEEAVHTLRAVAARLPWRAYLASLLGLMRLLRLQPSLEKRLVRALVAWLGLGLGLGSNPNPNPNPNHSCRAGSRVRRSGRA